MAESMLPLVVAIGLALVAAGLLAWVLITRRKANLFQQAWAALPHPRQIVDASGRELYANPAFRRVFGSARRPTPELLMAETDDDEARDQIARLAANARNGKAGQAEVPVRVRPGADDGSELEWRLVAARPIAEAPGSVFWQVDDITPRRQLEQVRYEEQARFADLFDHAPIGFYSVDGEGRFLLVNRTLGKWLGRDPDEIVGRDLRLQDLLAGPPPLERPAYDPFDPDGRGEISFKDADGKSFDAQVSQDTMLDPDGRVIRTRSVVRHLSQEQEMADALAKSRRRFERFFEDAPVGIALVDGNGKIREYNQKMLSLVAAEERLPPDCTLESLADEDSLEALQAGLALCTSGEGGSGPELPVEVRMRGDPERSCAVFMTPLGHRADGGVIIHFIDTTEQKNLELQFVQSQKMQAVGQLAGGIAHDFNNLLTAMIGFSDLLLLRHQPGDQSFADIMQIKQNAIRAGNLVRQLLAFSRQQTLQPRVLVITDILAELSHLLRRLIGENIELKMIHGRDLGPVKADQVQLEQVIINLAVNARDAMAGGGLLSITTDNLEIATQIKHRGEIVPPGTYSRIKVSDTGCGIDDKDFDRIFEPFYSTKEVGDGTGLGLSTVYGIVKQSGGFVYVESEPDVGSRFSILLPHHVAPADEEAESDAAADAGRDLTGMGRVLLVEDEESVRAFSARALRDKGYQVLEAPSGEAALEMLAGEGEPVDLLITDVVMPRLDGPALVREVRDRRPDLNVIFISGYTEDTFRRRLDREVGIHFLPKPFTLKQLAGKVKEVMHPRGQDA